jgi:hypothetical protein
MNKQSKQNKQNKQNTGISRRTLDLAKRLSFSDLADPELSTITGGGTAPGGPPNTITTHTFGSRACQA